MNIAVIYEKPLLDADAYGDKVGELIVYTFGP